MGVVGWVDDYQRRHGWVGMPLAVLYKFYDDQGSYLTALITYYGFLSLFPLLLLLLTVLGFLLSGNADLQAQVLTSALRQFPVIGDQIRSNVHSFHGSTFALVIGIVGSVYGSLGVVQATQNAMNRAWGVPRNARPNPIKSRLRSLLMLAIIGVGVALTSALSGLTTAAEAFGSDAGTGVRAAATVLSVAVNLALFLVAYRLLTARPLRLRQIAVGAVIAAASWQVLQWVGTYYLAHMLRGASATYGLFGIVLGLVAWIYLGALTLVLGVEINVVRSRRLWPRSLLTPFTDNVRLTASDRRAYKSYAGTEQHKGFERIDVDFDDPHADGGTPAG
jgi:YihY family inner membrane protein